MNNRLAHGTMGTVRSTAVTAPPRRSPTPWPLTHHCPPLTCLDVRMHGVDPQPSH